MTHVFTQVGTYALELRVENVRPSDFDDSNNRVTTSIAIVEPSDFTFYSFQAWSSRGHLVVALRVDAPDLGRQSRDVGSDLHAAGNCAVRHSQRAYSPGAEFQRANPRCVAR